MEEEATPPAMPIRTGPAIDLVDQDDVEALQQATDLPDTMAQCRIDPASNQPRGFSAFADDGSPAPPSPGETPFNEDEIPLSPPSGHAGGSTTGIAVRDRITRLVPGPRPRPTPSPSTTPSTIRFPSVAAGDSVPKNPAPRSTPVNVFRQFGRPSASVERHDSTFRVPFIPGRGAQPSHQDSPLPSIESEAALDLSPAPDTSPRPVDPASRRITPAADRSDDEEIEEDCRRAVARTVLDTFTRFPGCSDREHEANLATHHTQCPGDHHDLLTTFDPAIPDVLSKTTFMGDGNDHLTASGINEEQIHRSLHGCLPPGRPDDLSEQAPAAVCLHKEDVDPCRPKVVPDQDSFLGFASSGLVERTAFHWTPVPNMMLNIRSNLHLDSDRRRRARKKRHGNAADDGGDEGEDDDGDDDGDDDDEDNNHRQQDPTKLAVRDTPHILFGDSEGTRGLRYYLLFPHLEVRGKSFRALTEVQLQRLTDQIILPAIRSAAPNDVYNRFPSNYAEARANAEAAQKEQRSTDGKGYRSLSGLSYIISSDYVGAMWDHMQATIAGTPGLADFKDFQLFFNAKGVKILHKSRQNLHHSLASFESHIQRVLDLDYVYLEDFYVDVAQEIICPESLSQVYLWRTCCLESLCKKLFGAADTRRGTHRFFTPAFLRDAANMSSVPIGKSRLRRAGLIFLQAYATWNSLFDAAKTFPFTHPFLEELALKPELRKTFASVARAPLRHLHIIETAFLHSKNRVHQSLTGGITKAHGVRLEFRINWPLYQAIQQELRLRTPPRSTETVRLPAIPTFVHAVQTRRFNHFLYRNANKFAAIFEYVRQAHVGAGRHWTWEATGIMAMLLRLLRFSLLSHELSREGALWWNIRYFPTTNRTWAGLDMKSSLALTGYGWPKAVVDWRRFRWIAPVRKQMLFVNRIIRQQYRAHRSDVNDFARDWQYLERCGCWLRRYREPPQQTFLLLLMVHVCLRWFRFDVLRKVFNCYPHLRENRKGPREDRIRPTDDTVFLSVSALEPVIGEAPYIAASNRMAVKTPADMFKHLFGEGCPDPDDASEVRGLSNNLSFRRIYAEGRALFAKHAKGFHNDATWVRTFSQELVKYHWIWPNLDLRSGIWCKPLEKRGATLDRRGIQFWALKKQPRGRRKSGDLHGWTWAGPNKDNWEPGRPPPYPHWLTWEAARVERHLRDSTR